MKILLVGAGGYGALYVRELMGHCCENIVFEGVVDPYAPSSVEYMHIKDAGIPIYDTMDAFYSTHQADLAVICTPPFLHREYSVNALAHGSNVLCEKPVASTLADAKAMLEAEKQYGRFIAIGYQWSFSDAITSLKRDILEGKLGAPLSLKTIISWPRNFAYYRRGSGWGGRIQKDGVPILDSIASNACAHYLHNMLFLLGDRLDSSASIDALTGDCLRANEIETFDTCTLKARIKDTDLFFAASHATEETREPAFCYRFERATVTFWADTTGVICAHFNDGKEVVYGNPFANDFKKLWDSVQAAQQGARPICTVETAMAHMEAINKLHTEIPYRDFPKDKVCLNKNGNGVYVPNLLQRLIQAYEEEKLLSELA